MRTFGPLGEISISLSGGGYRAAAFHLGTLSMLNELELLKDVTNLSTVSGGTIAGAKYMADISSNPDFGAFEESFRQFLSGTNVVTEAIMRLDKTDSPNGKRLMPSLIRAAANVYADETFLGSRTLGELSQQNHGLGEVVFNATDFLNGSRFRFQISQSPRVFTGSEIDVPKGVSDSIRLADIVAASSCFPGGFEPFRFPGDFVWTESLPDIRKKLGDGFPHEIPLMDGGIVDNQGIDSIVRILGRAGRKTDLFLISDTSQRTSKVYSRHTMARKGILPVWLFLILLALLFGVSIISIATLSYELFELLLSGQYSGLRLIFLTVFPLLPAVVITGVLFSVGRKLYSLFPLVKQQLGKNGSVRFAQLKLNELKELIASRVGSVLKMTTNVFMSRIRSLGYTIIYSDKELRPILVSNFIYDLDARSEWKHEIPEDLHPTRDSRALALRAERYPTTLNFEGKQKAMETLICCGRMTTCLNILRYLHRVRKDSIHDAESEIGSLYERTKTIWLQLNRPGRRELREATAARQEFGDKS